MSLPLKIFIVAFFLFVIALISHSLIIQAIGWAVLVAGWIVQYKEYKSHK